DLTESVTVTASRGSDKARAVLKVHPRLSYPVGRRPVAIGFDGARLWVAGAWDLDVLILRPSDAAPLGRVVVNHGVGALVFDGTNLWVANHDRPPPGGAGETVTCVRPSDGANLGNVYVGPAPWFVIADGSELWVTSLYAGLVTQLDTTSGGLLQTGRIGNGANVQGMTVARGSLWFGLVPGSVVKR